MQTCARVLGTDASGEGCTAAECQQDASQPDTKAVYLCAGTDLNMAFYFQEKRTVTVHPSGGRARRGSSRRDLHVSFSLK